MQQHDDRQIPQTGVLDAAEGKTFVDRHSGTLVRQLTDHRCHSHHPYFTNPGWWDQGRRLLFGSDRGNRSNLFSVELASGVVTQITDGDMPGPPDETSFLFTSVNPRRDEAYFWRGRDLLAVDLRSCIERKLYECPVGFIPNITSVTADGKYVVSCATQQMSGDHALLRGYRGFKEYFEFKPLSHVTRVSVDGGGEIVHEDRLWIGHVNASPTQPRLLSICHEGPWEYVAQRMWGLDLSTGKTWKIRPQEPGEHFGHEYWMADGVTLGFHGAGLKGKVFGSIRYDNQAGVESSFPFDNNHYHSLDLSLIVADGGRGGGNARHYSILLYRYADGRFEGPRVLCEHRCSAHVQQLHVHPRISPDGKKVLFTSDTTGYGQLYLADLRACKKIT